MTSLGRDRVRVRQRGVYVALTLAFRHYSERYILYKAGSEALVSLHDTNGTS